MKPLLVLIAVLIGCGGGGSENPDGGFVYGDVWYQYPPPFAGCASTTVSFPLDAGTIDCVCELCGDYESDPICAHPCTPNDCHINVNDVAEPCQ